MSPISPRPKLATRRRGGTLTAALISIVVLGFLAGSLVWLGGYFRPSVDTEPLVVYCASGVRPAVQPIARQYEDEFGVPVSLQPGSSGVLEAQLRERGSGDLYIPAGIDPFLARGRDRGYVEEIIRLAGFHLVLAVQPGNPKRIHSLDDLLRDDVDVVMANDEAAVGRTARLVLRDWDGFAVLEKKATKKPTVTEVANDVQIGVRADVGLVWDATAKQFSSQLDIVEVDEIQNHPDAHSVIAAGVLSFTKQPTAALRFARYLAAPEKGQPSFRQQNFEPLDGDPWAVHPKISLFSGGVNRVAIEQTLNEFQQREGCEIISTFQGCGSLVAMMKTGQLPDAYFACDVSFVDQVAHEFRDPVVVSETDMIMLVQRGNPKNIHSLADLAREGIRVGIADEKLSALGRLTVQLLEEAGVYEAVINNRRATTPTADLLVTQLRTVDILDAAIVYRANCSFIGDSAEIVPIDHPAAKALQPLAIQSQAKYPQLAERLMHAIVSTRSQSRFEKSGFRWHGAKLNSNVWAQPSRVE